jgi:predicted HicB family RNase H-like nuclease
MVASACAIFRHPSDELQRRVSKSKVLNIRIDPELKKRAKKIATADGRSLSNWVTRLIVREVENAEKKKSRD